MSTAEQLLASFQAGDAPSQEELVVALRNSVEEKHDIPALKELLALRRGAERHAGLRASHV